MHPQHPQPIRERRHRLPREHDRGRVTAAFTLCIKDRVAIFEDPFVVAVFTEMLGSALKAQRCVAPVFCFMPDHLHVIAQGLDDLSEVWRSLVTFKQQSGYWLKLHRPWCRWQKDFYDHVVRKGEDLRSQVLYVLDNPVRRGLVKQWEQYPYKGAIGYDLAEVLGSVPM
ncbi:MAG: transposase [Nitrospirae bacterium]|nr:transposase [Nitrospirota bacterium]